MVFESSGCISDGKKYDLSRDYKICTVSHPGQGTSRKSWDLNLEEIFSFFVASMTIGRNSKESQMAEICTISSSYWMAET